MGTLTLRPEGLDSACGLIGAGADPEHGNGREKAI